jgi:hypothetical protein
MDPRPVGSCIARSNRTRARKLPSKKSKEIFATLLTRGYSSVHASKGVCRQACDWSMVKSSTRERIRL